MVGVDAARGLALFGMIAVHVTPSVGADGGSTAAHLVASGRASALFAVLAGVGLALASGGSTEPRGTAPRQARAATAVRAGFLVVVGLAIGLPDSGVAVILVYYGVLFLAAIPFLGLRAPALFALAGFWALTAPVLSHVLRLQGLPRTSGNVTTESLADPVGLFWQLTVTGYYPVLPWLAYVLAGLALGRLTLASTSVAARIFAGGAALAVGTYVLSWVLLRQGVMDRLTEAGTGGHPTSRPFTDGVLNTSFYGTTPTTTAWWLTVASPHTATPFDMLHTIGTAAAVLGLTLLLASRFSGLLSPLAAVGSMTFTLYSVHVLLLATAIPGNVEYAAGLHMAVALAIAVPWRRYAGRGPLEAVTASAVRSMRKLTAWTSRL
nr:heparan-alpha-glucosaminide N-acetyltransferase domain-containing protein [Phytoactinopolyspora alkaliphila]